MYAVIKTGGKQYKVTEGDVLKVVVEVLSQGKGPKVINFKYKPKKASHRKRGHRQLFTEVKVTSIIA